MGMTAEGHGAVESETCSEAKNLMKNSCNHGIDGVVLWNHSLVKGVTDKKNIIKND